MDSPDPNARAQPKCPDCPALRRHVLPQLVAPGPAPCQLQRLTLPAHESIPPECFKGRAFALVRRGVVIRQRTDASGRAVSIDAAGPGAFLPLGQLGSARGSVATGYAASDVLLCVYPDLNEGSKSECLSQPTALELFKLQTEALERTERIADARSRTSVARRVGALLCALADTLSPPARETIPALQQRDLAALIETRHESLCRVLRKFERQIWIARTPEHITILNRAALEEQ